MRTVKEIAWLAGLLEGEGSFNIKRNRGIDSSVTITVQMTDSDTIQHVAELFKRPMFGPYSRTSKPHWKPVYSTSVSGSEAAGWMMTLYPMMGARRQEKIREVLTFWKSYPRRTA